MCFNLLSSEFQLFKFKFNVLLAGNDLARCLNWGGGLGSVRSRGLDHCLLEVALAQQVQVDRWRVCIEPQVRGGRGMFTRA